MSASTVNQTIKSVERKVFITERAREAASVTKQVISRDGILLQYKLITTTDSTALGGADLAIYNKVFSLLIIKTTHDLHGTYDETVFIYDVTRSEEAALKLLQLLSENYVTPEEAKYVIDDIL